MIIILSKDFAAYVQTLKKLYAEPSMECLEKSHWLENLSALNKGKFVSRLTFIGHSDSFYGDKQSFFGGNEGEKIMLIEEFAHSLISMIKYNEIQKPGFCKHLKHIDLIDCHNGENKCIAELVANYLKQDHYIGDYGAHIKIASFAHSQESSTGTILALDPINSSHLLFYTFHSVKVFLKHQKIHDELLEQRNQLFHFRHMPRHKATTLGGQTRQNQLNELEKTYALLEKQEKQILQGKFCSLVSINDPRQFLDQHPSCHIPLAKSSETHQTPAHRQHPNSDKLGASSTNFFSSTPPRYSSYLQEHTLYNPKHPNIDEAVEQPPYKKF